MFLARHHGWLDANRVRLVETPSATDSLHLVGSGLVEAAALTLDEVLRARALGLLLVVPMVFDVSAGADGLLAHSPIPLAELAGMRIGVEPSAVGALMLAALLERAGLTVEQIQTIHLAYHEHAAAWRAGRIDALITFEPTLSALEAEGAVRLFESRAMPDTIVDVLAVHAGALANHGAALGHLVGATLHAVRDMTLNRMDAVYRIGARLGQPPETVLASLRGIQLADLQHNSYLLLGSDPPLRERAGKVAASLQGAGILPPGDGILRERLFKDLIHAEYLPLV
jgi:NitT/TauT family transport system substrate-binding protein